MDPFYIHIKVEPGRGTNVDREMLLNYVVGFVEDFAGDMAKVRGQIGKRKSYNDLTDIKDLSAAE